MKTLPSPLWHQLKPVVVAIIFALILIPFNGEATGTEKQPSKQIPIGVLAKRGAEHALKKWGPTADYLTQKIPGYHFKIQPLDFRSIFPAVKHGEVDFVLANSSFYVELEALYGIQRIATLRNRVGNAISTVFGGVIFVRADNDRLKVLRDLRGRSFMGVDEESFGGFRMGLGELKKNDINPYEDMNRLVFGGTHDNVVYAVQDGKVDAGTVRTDTLERMADEGKINLNNFRVFSHYPHDAEADFQFLHSTPLYPEWPFASLSSTPVELTQAVAIALLKMPAESPAALSSKGAGWSVPHNYQPVHDLLKGLQVGIYQHFGKVTYQDVLRLYWHWLLLGLLALVTTTVTTIHASRLNTSLNRSRQALQEAKDNLEARVHERTIKLEQTSRDKQLLLDSAGEGQTERPIHIRSVQSTPLSGGTRCTVLLMNSFGARTIAVSRWSSPAPRSLKITAVSPAQ
ncbi:MAG: phosphate/phosphite/phosphonate ABC transporter substrate-binding protein [Gammaproteobacteria bacterium]|nr:phosphate/phosphite/phosphonate ABC transporter substrate-binding protein [Gammaproteobacteria bacterium]